MAGKALSQAPNNDKTRSYRTFNPSIDNPIERLDDSLRSLDFLAMAVDKTASDFLDEKMDLPEQRGLANLLRMVRREINDVTQYLDDQGVESLLECQPRQERHGEDAAVLGMVADMFKSKNTGEAAEGEEVAYG